MMSPTDCLQSFLSGSWIANELDGSIRETAGGEASQSNQSKGAASGTASGAPEGEGAAAAGADDSPDITPQEAFNAIMVEGESLLADMYDAALVYPNTFDRFLNNMDLNRIPHLYCYDHTRVVVSETYGKGDYYHASLVDGYNKKSAYIFAQAPFDDASEAVFWRMVVDQKPSMILVFGGIDEKQKRKQPHNIADKSFEKAFLAEFGVAKMEDVELKAQINRMFWPAKDGDKSIEKVTIKTTGEHSEPHMKTYNMNVHMEGKDYPAILMHFAEWGANGADELPEYMLDMRASIKVQYVRSSKKKNAFMGPIMLVCATGVAKCTSYAMVDIITSRMTEEHTVGFKETMSALKSQRYGHYTLPPLTAARTMLMKFAVSTGCVHEEAIGEKPPPKARSKPKSIRAVKDKNLANRLKGKLNPMAKKEEKTKSKA